MIGDRLKTSLRIGICTRKEDQQRYCYYLKRPSYHRFVGGYASTAEKYKLRFRIRGKGVDTMIHEIHFVQVLVQNKSKNKLQDGNRCQGSSDIEIRNNDRVCQFAACAWRRG